MKNEYFVNEMLISLKIANLSRQMSGRKKFFDPQKRAKDGVRRLKLHFPKMVNKVTNLELILL